ncbi:MAG: hypothetical protein H7Z43_14250 [Clostridia bacterium]|nr:hypothetical protein [Deltaproteobacteria bacterium]
MCALAFSGALGVYDAATARDDVHKPGPREFKRLMPEYPGAAYHAASESLHIDGTQRFMAYAMTDDDAGTVLERYRTIFEARGLDVSVFPDGIVARATDDDWLRTIAITGQTIIASIAHEAAPIRATPLPTPPHCTSTETGGARDNGTTRETVVMHCAGYRDQVLDYYDALMSHAAKHDDTSGPTTIRTYEAKSGEHMTVIVHEQQDATPPTTGVSLYWEAQ